MLMKMGIIVISAKETRASSLEKDPSDFMRGSFRCFIIYSLWRILIFLPFSTRAIYAWNMSCRATSMCDTTKPWDPRERELYRFHLHTWAASAPRFTSSAVAIHEVYRPAVRGAQRYPMTTPVAGVKVVCPSIRCAMAFLTCRCR